MKKLTLTLLSFILTFSMFAGGLVTNTNQSAAWSRMLVRDASTDIDAAYYNPAGLTKLSDGFHLSISNQSIFQKRTISNSALNKEYEGSVSAPFFPNFYAAYKTGKIVFSAGFVPIGGGGSAAFDDGVPMIDLMLSQMPPMYGNLASVMGTTMTGAFSRDASFEGSSVYFSVQGGISYEITEMLSIYAGGRYVMAKNTTKGEITNIALQTANPEIIFTYDYVFGVAGEEAAAPLDDYEIDVEQTGNAFAPIVGVNLSFMEEKLNIGIKYEFQTNLEVTNDTKVDDVGMYPDGEKTNADIPAQLSIGVNYKITDDFSAQIGYHTYFDKGAGWSEIGQDPNKISVIDNNYWELGIGFEYNISEQLLISAGYLRAQTGVNDFYHTDMSYSLPSNTFGLGGAYKINEMLTLQLGGYYTGYVDGTITEPFTGLEAYTQSYTKRNLAFAVGLDFTFGGK